MADNPTSDVLRLWRPTTHYARLLTEGRNRPAPSIGSPTLIWHLGIWRRRIEGGGYSQTSTRANIEKYLTHNKNFFDEVSSFLLRLQHRGLTSTRKPQGIVLEKIPVPDSRNDGTDPFQRFEAFLPQSLNFELWWLDGANKDRQNHRLDAAYSKNAETDGAIRVFVQFQSFQDHVTCTFYMDIAQKFDGTQILDADELAGCGIRKRRFGEVLHTIRKASLGQIESGAINAPDRVSPNSSLIADHLRLDPIELREAVEFVYKTVWDDFQGAFGFQLADSGSEDLKSGVVFVNLRGLMMSHRGLETPADEKRSKEVLELKNLNKIRLWGSAQSAPSQRPWKPSERTAGDTLGSVDLFDKESCEAEVVVRSFGPFFEEMSPGAPDKDWIGCGILDWRAIFVSPLGSRAEVSLDASGRPLSEPTKSHWPERFLVLSKGEPNKQQIGRFIERITSVETIRAFALRNLGLIQNSYHYLGVLTYELDNVLKFWNERRQFLKNKFDIRRSAEVLEADLEALARYIDGEMDLIKRKGGRLPESADTSVDQNERLYYEMLSHLNESIEKKLIEITADMEGMGPRGSGHVLQDIQHAIYHIEEFNRMIDTLEIGNLHGWINYEQFADRGMRPTFNMIQKAGDRLRGAQERIKALTDVIQVSGLIVQSGATRRNTTVLRSIARDFGNIYLRLVRLQRLATFIAIVTGGATAVYAFARLAVLFGWISR